MSFAYLSSTPGLKFNYSLYAVPAAWVIGTAPLWWAAGVAGKAAPGSFTNVTPFENPARLKEALPEKTYQRVVKALAANHNSHINLGFFAASLAAANAAHVESHILHLCAGAYLGLRVAYNFAYVLIEDETWSLLRSACYLGGVGSCFTLLIQAANKMKAIPW